MTSMPHLPLMRWNYRDQLEATAQQVVNDGTRRRPTTSTTAAGSACAK